ncbi:MULTISPECIES: TetR/AcrR family transcriptional regulator [Paraburkholderia]|uniref:TetR/AcrR family transcriptional regulator n=1 Tax=Paraburkholderia TaxID=1822464 RepID=UPI002AB6B63B|nr:MULTISPECIES: TetR/AcrR family transcriptional regulator [Paraburkholderia]
MPTPRRPRVSPPLQSAPAASAEAEPRGTRRKRETRKRLLDAALRLMAEKGMEGVAINEITEAADVGFGSFYNHFESKEAIHEALTSCVFEDFADTLDQLTRDLSDPAEVVSVSVRHTVLRANRDPLWAQFLLREGFSSRAISRGLGRRLMRDVGNGIVAGRFAAEDPLLSVISVGGTVLGAIALQLQFRSPEELGLDTVAASGISIDHLAERTAATLLQTLGLARPEAVEIASRPLAAVTPPVESA